MGNLHGRVRGKRLLWLLGAVLLFPLFSIAASAATWIVDDDGGSGVDFTDIPAAVSAASPGDLILVRDGNYSGFTLEKALTLVADTGHQPVITEMATVTAIPAPERAVISGFLFYRIQLTASAGAIVLDDCVSVHYLNDWTLCVDDCDQVVVSRCHMEHTGLTFNGRPAISILDSTVIVSASHFIGAEGYDNMGVFDNAENGQPGISAERSTLYFQSSSSKGGQGGIAYELIGPGQPFAGNGGAGIVLVSSTLHLFGSPEDVISGGLGGFNWFGMTYGIHASAVNAESSVLFYSGVTLDKAASVPAIKNNGSSVSELDPPLPVITLDGSGQMGDHIDITLICQPTSQYFLFYSRFSAAIPVGQMLTHFHLDPAFLFYFAGGIYTGGNPPSYHVHIPSGSPGKQGRSFFIQGYVITQLGGSSAEYLSTSAAFVIR